MGKTMETKEQILERLKGGRRTVTELSGELGLAKSTVSQHLDELEKMGAVKGEINPHFRRIKYFEVNPTFSAEELRGGRGAIGVGLATIAILGLVASFYFTNVNLTSSSAEMPCLGCGVSTPQVFINPIINAGTVALLAMLLIVIEVIYWIARYWQKANRGAKSRINPRGLALVLFIYALSLIAVLNTRPLCYYTTYYPLAEVMAALLVVISVVAAHLLIGRDNTALMLNVAFLVIAVLIVMSFGNVFVTCALVA
jgi:DNA-binding transcriptional ArsR family regulator